MNTLAKRFSDHDFIITPIKGFVRITPQIYEWRVGLYTVNLIQSISFRNECPTLVLSPILPYSSWTQHFHRPLHCFRSSSLVPLTLICIVLTVWIKSGLTSPSHVFGLQLACAKSSKKKHINSPGCDLSEADSLQPGLALVGNVFILLQTLLRSKIF